MLDASSTASTPSSSDSCCNHLQAQWHACRAQDIDRRCQPTFEVQQQPLLGVLNLSASIGSLHRMTMKHPQDLLACR